MENQKLPGATAACGMILCVLLSVWLGVSGPIVSDVKAIGMMAVIEKWQTLIGVAGAFLIAWVAVQPVWRQVRIMGAQAALQLQPVLLADLRDVDLNIAFHKKLRGFETKIANLSAQLEFWQGSEAASVDAWAQELLAIRTEIARLADDQWLRFADRLGLNTKHRVERNDLRQLMVSISEQSTELTLRQKTPPDEQRAEFVRRITTQFSRDFGRYLRDIRAALGTALNRSEISLNRMRGDLIMRGEELQRSLENIR